MTNAARIAFIGAGNHATESLYPNIAHIPEFDLVAACDLDAGKTERAARKFGVLGSYSDIDRMLDEVRPQGVCVCGPGPMHYEIGLKILRRGIPVFMEKPPGESLADVTNLAETAKANGTWGMVAFMKRFAPANMVAKERMADASFGALSSITLIHGSGPYDDIRRMLLYNGIHIIDLARFFGGDVSEVGAIASGGAGRTQAVAATFRFASGAAGLMNMNSGHTWSDCFEQVYASGSGSALLIDASRSVEAMSSGARFAKGEGLNLFGWSERYYVSGNMSGWWASGHYTRGYWGEMDRFAKAVLGQAEPSPSLEDGVEAMRIVEAIMESVETGRAVTLA